MGYGYRRLSAKSRGSPIVCSMELSINEDGGRMYTSMAKSVFVELTRAADAGMYTAEHQRRLRSHVHFHRAVHPCRAHKSYGCGYVRGGRHHAARLWSGSSRGSPTLGKRCRRNTAVSIAPRYAGMAREMWAGPRRSPICLALLLRGRADSSGARDSFVFPGMYSSSCSNRAVARLGKD